MISVKRSALPGADASDASAVVATPDTLSAETHTASHVAATNVRSFLMNLRFHPLVRKPADITKPRLQNQEQRNEAATFLRALARIMKADELMGTMKQMVRIGKGIRLHSFRYPVQHTVLRVLQCVLFAVLLIFGGTASVGQSAPSKAFLSPRAFVPGERLTYAVTWLKIRAGTAVMEVQEGRSADGQPALKLMTRAQSEPPVSSFFLIDDRVKSTVDAWTLAPQRMLFQKNEGKKHTAMDVIFHHAEGTATTIKDGVTETTPIPPDTQHAFSALYYLRNLPSVTVGSTHRMNVHHEKKNYPIEVRVEALEEISGAWGDINALRVSVYMPFTGIWVNAGSMQVWVTNDVRHVPLKVKAKVVIGSIVAELVDGGGISHEFDDSKARNSF